MVNQFKNIGFLGCGNMGTAILDSWINFDIIKAENIYIHNKTKISQNHLIKSRGVKKTYSIEELFDRCDCIFLGVKPQIFSNIFSKIKVNSKNILFVSIMAGLSIKYIQKLLNSKRVIRTMPNLPILEAQGITVLAKKNNKYIKLSEINAVKKLFESCGKVLQLDESLMDGVTSISGSGPAYVFNFLDALINAGIKEGIDSENSFKLSLQTLKGALILLENNKISPKQWIKKVASKGGTTEAALEVMKNEKFSSIIQKSVKAAAQKSRELKQT